MNLVPQRIHVAELDAVSLKSVGLIQLVGQELFDEGTEVPARKDSNSALQTTLNISERTREAKALLITKERWGKLQGQLNREPGCTLMSSPVNLTNKKGSDVYEFNLHSPTKVLFAHRQKEVDWSLSSTNLNTGVGVTATHKKAARWQLDFSLLEFMGYSDPAKMPEVPGLGLESPPFPIVQMNRTEALFDLGDNRIAIIAAPAKKVLEKLPAQPTVGRFISKNIPALNLGSPGEGEMRSVLKQVIWIVEFGPDSFANTFP